VALNEISLLQAIVYGIVQGATEFLPVSSNAHIRIVPALLHWQDPGAAFTAVIQLGTVLAVLIYFAKDLGKAFTGWLGSLTGKNKDSQDAKVGWAVLYGTLPIVVLGLAFHKQIEGSLRSLYIIAGTLIFMGFVMFIADKYATQKRGLDSVTPKDGLITGLWQALALLPGMSRSGSTISGLFFAGFDRNSAARFSFLMSVPSVALAGLYEAFKERAALSGPLLMPIAVATIVSFIVGYAAIAGFIKFLQKNGIGPFVVYRIVLGIVLIGLLQAKVIEPEAGAKPLETSAASVQAP
jgi:undecaprenyl-diphosphatase